MRRPARAVKFLRQCGAFIGARIAAAIGARPVRKEEARPRDLFLEARVVAVPAEVRLRAELGRERALEEGARFGAHPLGLGAEAEVERAGAGFGQRYRLLASPEPGGRAQQLVARVAARERPGLRAAVVELDVVFEREPVASVGVQCARGRDAGALGRGREGEADARGSLG